jgi:hypothetical protein
MAMAMIVVLFGINGVSEAQDKRYKLEVEHTIAEDAILLTLVRIQVNEPCVIKFQRSSSFKSSASIKQDDLKGGSASATIVLFAALVETDDKNWEKHLFKIITPTTRVGGPGSGTLNKSKTLKDVASFDAKAGDYKFKKEVKLGTYQDAPLILIVE